MTALAMLLGAGFAAGALLTVAGLRGLGVAGLGLAGGGAARGRPRPRDARRRLLIALAAALGGTVLTRMPVMALLCATLAFAWPSLFGARARKATIDRVEAIAVWVEMLRDVIAAASGLEEAVLAASRAGVAPDPIRAEAAALEARLESRVPFRTAVRLFADELADPSADKVVVALVQARERRVKDLGQMLSALAASTRDNVAMRLRVDTEREKTRASARFVTLFSLAAAALLLLFAGDYLEPYRSPLGQAALACVGLIFAAAFAWLQALQRDRPQLRPVAPSAPSAGGADRWGRPA